MNLRYLGIGLFLSVIVAGCSSSSGGGTGGGGGSGGAGGGGTVDFAACDGPGQCVMALKGCCESCGVTRPEEYEPINDSKASAHFDAVCSDKTPGGPVCDACISYRNPNIFATCEQSACVAADLRAHAFGACSTADDCRLRMGASCCEACQGFPEGLTAIAKSQEGAFLQAVCSPLAGACDDCAPQYPAGYVADCVNSQCVVTQLAAPN